MSNIHEHRSQSDGTLALTRSILINVFFELRLNNFFLPPLPSIVFVRGSSGSQKDMLSRPACPRILWWWNQQPCNWVLTWSQQGVDGLRGHRRMMQLSFNANCIVLPSIRIEQSELNLLFFTGCPVFSASSSSGKHCSWRDNLDDDSWGSV